MKANAPEKIYVHEASAPELTEKLPYHIEYTRTDAFIEKARKYLEPEVMIMLAGDKIDTDKFIEDFKKYMKGE